jgi:hypothetical protein
MGSFTNQKMVIEKDRIMEGVKGVRITDSYGLCSKCENLMGRRSRLGSEEIWCDRYERVGQMIVKPSKQDPIDECSYYWPKGQPSLNEMLKISHIIDVKTKNPVGFTVGNGEREVAITAPVDDDKPKAHDWTLDE